MKIQALIAELEAIKRRAREIEHEFAQIRQQYERQQYEDMRRRLIPGSLRGGMPTPKDH